MALVVVAVVVVVVVVVLQRADVRRRGASGSGVTAAPVLVSSLVVLSAERVKGILIAIWKKREKVKRQREIMIVKRRERDRDAVVSILSVECLFF